jgi:hypothetical protein
MDGNRRSRAPQRIPASRFRFLLGEGVRRQVRCWQFQPRGIVQGGQGAGSSAAPSRPAATLAEAAVAKGGVEGWLYSGIFAEDPHPALFQRAPRAPVGDRYLIKAAWRPRKAMRSLKSAALSRSAGEGQKVARRGVAGAHAVAEGSLRRRGRGSKMLAGPKMRRIRRENPRRMRTNVSEEFSLTTLTRRCFSERCGRPLATATSLRPRGASARRCVR